MQSYIFIFICFCCLCCHSQAELYNKTMRPLTSTVSLSLQMDVPCGIAEVSPGIINGEKAQEGQMPWQVSIQSRTGLCGGVLIHPSWVVTAAHCMPSTIMQMHAGGLRRFVGTRLFPERAIIHSGFSTTRVVNDIGLIKLKVPAPYTRNVRPICLPPANAKRSDYYGKTVILSGFGKQGTYEHQFGGFFLRKATSLVENNVDRQKKRPNTLCTSAFSGSGCSGDSGGPVVYLDQSTGRYELVGIMSVVEVSNAGLCKGVAGHVSPAILEIRNWMAGVIAGTETEVVDGCVTGGTTRCPEFGGESDVHGETPPTNVGTFLLVTIVIMGLQ